MACNGYGGQRRNIKLALDGFFIRGVEDFMSDDIYDAQPSKMYSPASITKYLRSHPELAIRGKAGLYSIPIDYPLASPKRIAIVDEYQRGVPIADISDHVGLSVQYVNKVIRDYKHLGLIGDTVRTYGKRTKIDDDDFIPMIGTHMFTEIADELGVSTATISRRAWDVVKRGEMPKDKMKYFKTGQYKLEAEA